MTGRNKNPLLGWHPPAELSEWARAEAERRGGKGQLSVILTEALAAYRAAQERVLAAQERVLKEAGP